MDPKEHSSSKDPLLDLAAAAAERPTHAGVRGPGRQARADDGCESGRWTGRETTREDDGAATSAGCQGSANGRLGKGGRAATSAIFDGGDHRRTRNIRRRPSSDHSPRLPLRNDGTRRRPKSSPSAVQRAFLSLHVDPREGRTFKRDATREKQSAPPTAAPEGNVSSGGVSIACRPGRFRSQGRPDVSSIRFPCTEACEGETRVARALLKPS